MTITLADDPQYTVLNAVALKKMATATQLSAATDIPEREVVAALAALADAGAVAVIGDAALPTDDAAALLADAAAERYRDVRSDPNVLEMADRFEVVNTQFLQTISGWQQVEVGGKRLPNDHTDPDYDGKILDRIDKQVGRLSRLICTLSDRDARFDAYVRRFGSAGDQIAAGDVDLVSSPVRESVHNIWFEFHEDLLRTLGRARKE